MTVDTFKLSGPEIDLAACHVTVTECLAHDRERFGPYGHGDRFLTYVWGSTRGMEYDGADHRLGRIARARGVPLVVRAGREAGVGVGRVDRRGVHHLVHRRAAAPSPVGRAVRLVGAAGGAASAGAVGPVHAPGGLHRRRPSVRRGRGAVGRRRLVRHDGALYRERVGEFVSTDELEAHLTSAAGGGDEIPRAFARWVHGLEELP